MIHHGFKRSPYDSCVYHNKVKNDSYIYLVLYVDDMLIASTNMAEIKKLKSLLNSEFDMKDLGTAERILGMKIYRDRDKRKLFLCQKAYIQKYSERVSLVWYVNSQTCKHPLNI